MRLPSPFFRVMIAIMAFIPVVHCDVTLPNVIGDHMVLQQGIAVPIWGEAHWTQPERVGGVVFDQGLNRTPQVRKSSRQPALKLAVNLTN